MSDRYNFEDVLVDEIMSTDLSVVTQETTLENLVDKFREEGYHAFPVCDKQIDGELVGIVSKSDLVESMGRKKMSDFFVTHVEDIMKSPVSIKPDKHVTEALEKMMKQDIRFLPITDEDNKCIGVVSYSDLAERIARN